MKHSIANFKSILVVTGLLLASFITGCKQGGTSAVADEPVKPATDVKTLAGYLSRTTGTDLSEIKYDEQQQRFTAHGDILISRDDLQEYYNRDEAPGAKPEHYRGTYLISDAYIRDMKVRIAVRDSNWARATRSAIDNWNGSNISSVSKLHLRVVSSGEDTRVFDGTNENSGWVARAYLPTSTRRPGSTVEINNYHNGLGQSTKVFAITHELGHSLGLLHTNQTQGTFIAGSPTRDANSVMNSFVLPWNGFTSGDVTAVRIIYPR